MSPWQLMGTRATPRRAGHRARCAPSDIDEVMEIERARLPRALVARGLPRGAATATGPTSTCCASAAAARSLGFVNYWLVRDEVHVLNVATHPDARRRGHAARLLEHVDRVRARARLPLRDARGAPLATTARSGSTASTASAPSASAPTTTSRISEDAIVMLLDRDRWPPLRLGERRLPRRCRPG